MPSDEKETVQQLPLLMGGVLRDPSFHGPTQLLPEVRGDERVQVGAAGDQVARVNRYYDEDDVGLASELQGATHWAHHDLEKAGIEVDVWIKPSGAPLLEFGDGSYVSFGLHDLISDALWLMEMDE